MSSQGDFLLLLTGDLPQIEPGTTAFICSRLTWDRCAGAAPRPCPVVLSPTASYSTATFPLSLVFL